MSPLAIKRGSVLWILQRGCGAQGNLWTVFWSASAFQFWYVQTYIFCSIWQESRVSLNCPCICSIPLTAFTCRKHSSSFQRSKEGRSQKRAFLPRVGSRALHLTQLITGVPELTVHRMNEIFFTLCLPPLLALLQTMKSWNICSLPRTVTMKTWSFLSGLAVICVKQHLTSDLGQHLSFSIKNWAELGLHTHVVQLSLLVQHQEKSGTAAQLSLPVCSFHTYLLWPALLSSISWQINILPNVKYFVSLQPCQS